MHNPTTVPYRQQDLRNYLAVLDTQRSNLLLPAPWRIGLKNLELGIMQVFELRECLVIGRGSSDDVNSPFLDMAPYSAYEQGVSRRHVILKRQENSIYIIDDNSSNGVILDGEILRPATAYPLRDGDTFSLGKMHLEIHFLHNPFTR